jgi:hypothetical protein
VGGDLLQAARVRRSVESPELFRQAAGLAELFACGAVVAGRAIGRWRQHP